MNLIEQVINLPDKPFAFSDKHAAKVLAANGLIKIADCSKRHDVSRRHTTWVKTKRHQELMAYLESHPISEKPKKKRIYTSQVVELLEKESLSAPRMAGALGVNKMTLFPILDSLKARGLVCEQGEGKFTMWSLP